VITVELTNQQSKLGIDADTLQKAVRLVLEGEGIEAAIVSLAVVDDKTIHKLNRQYLDHDYTTDVLSFVLSHAPCIEGEVIVSAETAERQAAFYGWSANEELMLYLVHGTLHLIGYNDVSESDRALMRERERLYLRSLGREPSYDDETGSRVAASPTQHAEGDSSP
jgi:probable rRNA maturation factor